MSDIVITVAGTPAPQGSKRHVGNGIMIESSKAVKPWREAVKAAALGTGSSMLLRPVSVDIRFFLLRPRSHYGTGRNSDAVKGSSPVYPKGKPDIDKLARSTLDGLSKICYEDDAQVILLLAAKTYALRGQRPGAVITIKEIL